MQRPYEVADGKLHIPDVPGFGLEWDEKAVAAHLADNFYILKSSMSDCGDRCLTMKAARWNGGRR